MPSNIDPKMLDSLSETVRSCLPSVRADIESFLHDVTQFDALESAYHSMHPITDVAEMLGLSVLHCIMTCIAGMIEEIASGSSPVDPEQGTWLCSAVDQIEPYLDSLRLGDGSERAFITAVVKSFRRFKNLPEDEDETAVEEVMAGQADVNPGSTLLDTSDVGYAVADVGPLEDVAYNAQDFPTESFDQMDFAAELIEGFLLEAEDYLDTIGRLLPIIGDHAEQNDQLLQVRRSVHTLKGAAGVVGFQEVSHLAHRMEDLLDELYDGNLPLTVQTKDLLFATFDVLEDFLRDKRAQGDLSPATQELYHTYAAVLGEAPVESIPVPDVLPAYAETLSESTQTWTATDELLEVSQAASFEDPTLATIQQPTDVVRVPISRIDELVRLVGELVISRSVYEQQLVRLMRQVEELHLSIERLQRTATTIETEYEVSALVGNRTVSSHQANMLHKRGGADWTGILEFDELEFDRYSEFHLMSRDLTETSADIGALGNEFKEILGEFDGYLARQSRLTSEIQDQMMQFRMVPLASQTTRLQRAVRVTAKQRDKDVAFVLEGEEVEFDKTMLEEINEALLHLLRNAVDHGIEPPTVRQTQGKSPQGTIRLRAFREGTQIVVQVSDDGAGLDPERLRASAVEKGVAAEADVAQWRDDQLYSLIFTPGFSTAPGISEVSGRGVGMDIVYTTISRLKGRITVDSTPGQGMTVTIRLPLTLAIAHVLLVQVHGQAFAIPLADVTQVVRLEPEAVEHVGDTKVVRVDGQVLPVALLGETLHLQQPPEPAEERLPIVIVQAGDLQVAFIVEQILGGREVVVKALGTHLRHVYGMIGSTLMGDGSIVLILNPGELLHGQQRQSPQMTSPTAMPAVRKSEAFDILIVDDSFSVRRVVANLVKSVGWQPILAKNGLEALEVIHRATRLPDLILLDVEMPQMDGYELTKTLRAHDAYCQVPIVMLTSRSGEKHRRKAFEVGATEYLVKPYRDAVLLDVVRRLVAQVRGTTAA